MWALGTRLRETGLFPGGLLCYFQEGGVNLLAQLWECAADDLSHYDVTSEPIREISMAAER